jgi:hypothetical protein
LARAQAGGAREPDQDRVPDRAADRAVPQDRRADGQVGHGASCERARERPSGAVQRPGQASPDPDQSPQQRGQVHTARQDHRPGAAGRRAHEHRRRRHLDRHPGRQLEFRSALPFRHCVELSESALQMFDGFEFGGSGEPAAGVGPATATALVATVGDPGYFRSGRQFAAWLGLVPRQRSSGGKEWLGGISKRGDGYLRRLLVHGARTVVRWQKRRDPAPTWLANLLARRPVNVATVALANKNARIAWALMVRNETFQPGCGPGARAAHRRISLTTAPEAKLARAIEHLMAHRSDRDRSHPSSSPRSEARSLGRASIRGSHTFPPPCTTRSWPGSIGWGPPNSRRRSELSRTPRTSRC